MHSSGNQKHSLLTTAPCLRIALMLVFLSLTGHTTLLGQTVTSTVSPADHVSKTPGSEINKDLPPWMRFTVEVRVREEGRSSLGYESGNNDTYTLTRTRLGLDLTPARWFHFYVQGQDSRAIGMATEHVNSTLKNTFDLRQGYAEFKMGEKHRVNLMVGRTELNLGNQRVVGGGDWGNVTRTFDVAKLTLGSRKNFVDIFSATPVIIYSNRFDKFDSSPGHNLYGIYGTLSSVFPKTTVEPYILWKTLPSAKSTAGVIGDGDIYTIGALAFSRLPNGFDYTIEMDRQFGHLSSDDLDAWAGYWIAGYTLPVQMRPRLSTEYTFATGNSGTNTGKVGTFDQVYGAFHNIYGMSDLFGWRNIRHLRLSGEFNPVKPLNITFDYHFIWLADAHDGLYNASGVEVVKAPTGGASSTNVGHDADLYVTYRPRPWLTIGTGWSYLFWGQFLKENAHGTASSYPWVFCTYRL